MPAPNQPPFRRPIPRPPVPRVVKPVAVPPPARPVQPPRPPVVRPVARPVARPAGPPLRNRSNELNHGAPAGWEKCLSIVLKEPVQEVSKHEPVLYAVIGSWHEADVIEATVRNCIANGTTKVFLVDNDSPDATRTIALSHGATLSHNYKTQYYDDDLRLRLMNDVIREVSEREKLPNLWWQFLDADEFCCGPDGQRILDYLKTLDHRVNCVGADCIDLYPTVAPYYTPGKHPADCMEHGVRRLGGKGLFCELGHWKHQLMQIKDGKFTTAMSRGSHYPCVPYEHGKPLTPMFEPPRGLVMFHAPMRAKDDTFKRLEALCSNKGHEGWHRSSGDDHLIQGQGAVKRWRSLEAVYNGEWDKVELPHSQIYGGNITGIALYPWRRMLKNLRTFPRWYPDPNPPQSRVPLTTLDTTT